MSMRANRSGMARSTRLGLESMSAIDVCTVIKWTVLLTISKCVCQYFWGLALLGWSLGSSVRLWWVKFSEYSEAICYEVCQKIVNIPRSYDPNDKVGPSGSGDQSFVESDSVMPYQVRFENQPKATAPAQRVLVTDKLDESLDLSTFELNEITFADQSIQIPPGLSSYETTLPMIAGTTSIQVHVKAELNPAIRELTLLLEAIDPSTGWSPDDPLVGLLYPEDGTGRGQGSISYIGQTQGRSAHGDRDHQPRPDRLRLQRPD